MDIMKLLLYPEAGGGRDYELTGLMTCWLGGGSGAGFNGIVKIEQGLYNYQVGKGGKKIETADKVISGEYDKTGGSSLFGNKIELSGGTAGALEFRGTSQDLGGKIIKNEYESYANTGETGGKFIGGRSIYPGIYDGKRGQGGNSRDTDILSTQYGTDGTGGYIRITYVGQTQEDVNSFKNNPVYNY